MFKKQAKGQRSKVKGCRNIAIILVLLHLMSSIATAETIDRIVAVVNSDIITESDVKELVSEYKKNNDKNTRRAALDRLIDELLLKHAVEKAKITVGDDDLTRAIQNVLRQNQITPEQLKADLAAKGMSFDTYKQRLAGQIRLIKFTNQIIGQQVKLTDRKVREYYERNKAQFGGEASNFKAEKEKVYDVLYEEKTQEALGNYLVQQRQSAYIDIRL